MIPPTAPAAPIEPTGVVSVAGDDLHLPEHLEPWLGGDRQMTRRVAKTAHIERKCVVRGQFVVSCPAWRWLHERGVCIVCVHLLRAGVPS